MSDETTPSAPETTDEKPVVLKVTRNDVELPFVEETISRGKAENTKYPAPEVTEDSLSKVIEWLTPKITVSILTRYLKLWAQNAYRNSLDSEKKFVEAKFIKFAEAFSVRGGEKIGELRKELAELNSQLLSINFAILSDPNHPQYAATAKKFQELGKDMQDIQAQIEMKERNRDPEEDEDETPAAVATS